MSGGNPLEPLLGQYRNLQNAMSKLQSNQSQATTQICENEMVLKELEMLEEEAQVFKLIGPVLVKQELVEVKSNVSKRIEYIKGDMGRCAGAAQCASVGGVSPPWRACASARARALPSRARARDRPAPLPAGWRR